MDQTLEYSLGFSEQGVCFRSLIGGKHIPFDAVQKKYVGRCIYFCEFASVVVVKWGKKYIM